MDPRRLRVRLLSAHRVVCSNEHKIKINKVKSSSFDRLEQTFKYQVSPALDYVGITKISDFDVYAAQAVLDYVKNQGYKYSTQKKTKDFLSDFFKFAVANNMAKLNPVWLITLKADKTIITEDDEEEKEKIIVFNNDEIERFKKACTAKYKNGVNRFHQGIFFIFMLNTGTQIPLVLLSGNRSTCALRSAYL